ncbi:MAG: hypothetical protein KAT30_02835, partial [Candidatus Krumholzibacteria bacterium]|nr:hypothetical protein [Candidatus Krumholzibacteria bacterium]
MFAQVSTERSPALKAAWAALWENDARKARTLFGASLAEDDKNLEARRGMILTDLLLCNERDVLEHLEKLSKTPGADLMDLLLARYYYVFVATHGKDEKTFVKICKELAKQKSIDPLDRRRALADLVEYATAANDRDAVEDAAKKLNRLDDLVLLGPFSNVSGGGHDKDFLQFPSEPLMREYQGLAGLEVEWYRPENLDLTSTVNFYNHYSRSKFTTCYVGFQLRVEKPRDLIVSITQSGALKVQLNDQFVLDIERVQSQREINHLKVHFEPGNHSLIFKCSTGLESSNIAVSLSELDGQKPKDIKIKPLDTSEGGSMAEATAEVLPLPGLVKLQKAYLENPDDPYLAFWYLLGLWIFQETE